ncbi:UDP-glucose 4-epimerase GalE [Domibacillus indicus]|uniref:UDP-glucose 4-epimerase GalE n=1 Tax=Domibacillus indicus TaxID=1437523 RepID=UPI00203E68E0|nr:UDP-glucose 4-epimerase GalE [Domibacillus indicus]MCM3788900.1 UDP-glucose 4-epimerase GalE [Domibacillus indicus]
MKVLVTGGAGFIGSHTALLLLEAGYEIVIADNFLNSSPEVLKRIEMLASRPVSFVELDLRDEEALDRLFSYHEFDSVIHFAGLKAVGESVEKPLYYYENNIGSTLTLCKVMEKFNVVKLVFSSSATVYGVPDEVPIVENIPLYSTNPYGRTKLMIEEILKDIHTANPNWRISLLRYFNPLGAHESGEIGEDPNGIPNNLMPYITQVAIGKRDKLLIFGGDYPTIDGTGVRDYIHVTDLAHGHIRALKKLNESTGIEAYNLGTGRGYSVLEVINTFESATGISVPYEIIDRRPGDIAECYADTTKTEIELGWKAKKTLEDMCRDSWRWQKKNPEGFRKKFVNEKGK